MKKKNAVPGIVTGPPRDNVLVIENLDQLTQLVEAPINVEFRLDGKVIRIPCRRVSQALDEQVRQLVRMITPKAKRGSTEYDYDDPLFIAALESQKKLARSVIVYNCCPAIAMKSPGLLDPQKIHSFVKGILTENIIELIHLTVTAGGMELADRVNFTSASVSES